MPAIKHPGSWRQIKTIIWCTITIVFLGMYLFPLFLIHNMFSHRVEIFETTPEGLGLEAETISLISSDNIIIKALWIPIKNKSPSGIVILLHGMEGMDASSMLGHARFLHEAGYSALVLDMRAHGRSGGQRIGLAIEEPLDVLPALNWIQQQPEIAELPLTIIGISLGGATALRVAAMSHRVDAVISIGSFSSIDCFFHRTMALKMKIPKAFITLFSPFIHLSMATLFGDWPAKASPLNDIKKIPPRPILIIHGAADNQIPLEHAHLLAKASNEHAELWIMEDENLSISMAIQPLQRVHSIENAF